ncbi:MAG: enoyl-CoA hydratase/isomerase family protein [Chloroflexi bacterium]|nr:enoyl-CoA hydratase/isomerase family protein [Chloroflexota bacterium]
MAGTYENVLYERRGRIAYLTINRPQVLNALNRQTQADIEAAKQEFAQDLEAWVLIMTGAGDRAFCAGADLKEGAERDREGAGAPEQEIDLRYILPVWKPMIAAINGWAMGGGLAYAMQCDIRIASENARMGYPEVRVGIPGGPSDNWLLPRYVPVGEAMYMLLTAEPVDAQEAHRIGLVHQVVPQAELLSTAERIAQRIASNSPMAVRAVKQAVWVGLGLTFEQSMRLNHALALQVRNSEDAREARRAFNEKREPVFRGR